MAEDKPKEEGKFFKIGEKWVSVRDFEDKKKAYGDVKNKLVNTRRYSTNFEETRKEVRPVGSEATAYDNIGEAIPTKLYDVLNSYKNVPPMVYNKQFDGGRNLDMLAEALKNPRSVGIASGRKPSGPCHFGHKLVTSTLGFFQQNGVEVFTPIADLEADLDPKIKNRGQHQFLAADNVLDWGATGLDLDAAHVYLQSEEMKVMNLAYEVARGLDFKTALDVYGRDTMVDGFNFFFAGMTQVGDIILPQHNAFGKQHSFMLSGCDQDGHMEMTMQLSKVAKERSVHIKNIPSSLYVRTITNLEGKKESASESLTSIYLGSARNVYLYGEKYPVGKLLDRIDKLSLEERIEDSNKKIDSFAEKDKGKVLESIRRRESVFPEFERISTIRDFKDAVTGVIKDHQKKRSQVYEYALLKTLREYDNSHDNLCREIETITKGATTNLPDFDSDANPARPSFWLTRPEFFIPEEIKGVKTKWNHMIAGKADEIVI